METNYYSGSKKSIWQWVLIYIVIGGAIYGLVYYFFFAKNNGYGNSDQYPASNYQVENNNQNSENQTNKNYMIENMKVEILQEGNGQEVKAGDIATMNYTGWLEDGTPFDSSLNPGRTPFAFRLGENSVIQGWELGVLGMKIGEKRKLTIPAELGYGIEGRPPVIPANATLIFDVELLKIN